MPTKINPSNQTITQYDTLSGGSNNLLNNISPGTLGQVLTSNGASAQPTFQNVPANSSISQINLRVFSTAGSATYTPTANMKYCIVEVIGGGGGGGNAVGRVGTGGGAGAYAMQIFSAATIGVSQSFTIGSGGGATASGGSSSFGSLITCGGGSGGITSGSSTPSAGGAGGTVSLGGTLTINGASGENGNFLSVNVELPGTGAHSYYGRGGHGGNITIGSGGNGQYGAGGGGGFAGNGGGSGGSGLILITEFI